MKIQKNVIPYKMTFILHLFFFSACFLQSEKSTEPETVESANRAKCAIHIDQPQAYGFCLASKSTRIPTIDRAKSYCESLGTSADDCRYNWVSARLAPNSGLSAEELISVCGNHSDCAFKVIDARPVKDIYHQFEMCKKHVPQFVHECEMHVVQRWWKTKPQKEEIDKALTLIRVPNASLPKYMAYVVFCDGIGDCDGPSLIAQECRKHLVLLEAKMAYCPKRNPNQERRGRPPQRRK